MAQSIKLGSDTYLDWSGVTVSDNGTTLKTAFDGVTGSGRILHTASKTSDSFNVTAGGTGSTQFNVSESGYTPIGILTISGSGTSGLSYSDWYFETSSSAKIYFRNNTTSNKTGVKLTVTILYIKS